MRDMPLGGAWNSQLLPSFVPEACLKTEIDATIRRGAQTCARRLLLRSPAAALRHLSSKGRRNGHIESRTKTTLRNTEEQ